MRHAAGNQVSYGLLQGQQQDRAIHESILPDNLNSYAYRGMVEQLFPQNYYGIQQYSHVSEVIHCQAGGTGHQRGKNTTLNQPIHIVN